MRVKRTPILLPNSYGGKIKARNAIRKENIRDNILPWFIVLY